MIRTDHHRTGESGSSAELESEFKLALDVLVMEHFIETVKNYPCLWDTNSVEYKDQEIKDAAWAEVHRETNMDSVKEVKNKWKKLRDSYRDALKRQNDMLAKDPHNIKKIYPWKYMHLMSFLQPHMSNRNKKRITYVDLQYPQITENTQNGLDHTSEDSDNGSETTNMPKRKNSNVPQELTAIEKKLDFLCTQQPKKPCPEGVYDRKTVIPDPLDIFFNSMCQSTKRLPYATQIKIKRILFNTVVEAEESLLMEQQNFTNMWTNGAPSSSSSDKEEDNKEVLRNVIPEQEVDNM